MTQDENCFGSSHAVTSFPGQMTRFKPGERQSAKVIVNSGGKTSGSPSQRGGSDWNS